MKIKENQYAKSLYSLTKDKDHKEIDGIISNFIKVLAKNGQVKSVSKIIQKFNEIWNENEGIVEAEVVSVRELDKEELHKIEKFIGEKYLPASLREALQAGEAKKVLINNKIDEKIKGGIIIKVKDEILDGSIANQLRNLKNNLSK